MKRYAAMLSSAILASCALVGGIQYGGQSATFGGDNILRNSCAMMSRRSSSNGKVPLSYAKTSKPSMQKSAMSNV
ncbi:hypothetical protein ACMYUL_04025 [Neisseria sp. CP9]|uniref:hypothetical protein n=1 Tax=Neisseria sp. CP9 TaxID=3388843 RepID=UPI0039EF13D4